MSARSDVQDRITLWMLEEAPDEPPNRVLEAVFERTRHMPQEGALRGRARVGMRAALITAATLILLGLLVTYAVIGGWLAQPTDPSPSPNALERLMSSGVLRVAVRPDHPQSAAPDGTLTGFDVDVATEIGQRLGLRVELVALAPNDLFGQTGRWDIGLPSTPAWSVDGAAFLSTSAYYAWPHLLLVPAGSGATSVDDVQGQPICAVAGDAGQAWLIGRYGPASPGVASTPPIPSTLILRASDAECLAALEAGRVRAVVTASMTPAAAAALPDAVTIDGPAPEPRVAVIGRAGDGSASLLEAFSGAIGAMRADGTLAGLSQARFGSDLTPAAP
jgi:polar amino acid transport system substrate-binding protein